MVKQLHTILKSSIFGFAIIAGTLTSITARHSEFSPAGCSDAGVANATADSVCYSVPVTLSLTGYLGTIFQWQSFDGTNWVDETGAGSNTDSYDVTLLATRSFRAIVTEAACPPDTSNEITITVGTIPVASASPAGRCGPGIVNLTGTGAGTLEWFTDPTGGAPIATGNTTSAFIPASTTLWVSDNVLGGGGTASPVQITEINIGATDQLEIQNVSPTPIDVTGWKVAINNSYTDINLVNANVQTLSGILQPGDILTWTDAAAGPNYWGSNMLWNPGAFPSFTGWVLIVDDQNNPKDFVALNWPDANIQAMLPVINGTAVSPAAIWTGDGVNIATVAASDGVSRTGTSDNDNLSDFIITPLNVGTTNLSMTLPFSGFGCTSPRIPVAITISSSDAVDINATSTSFCQSGSTTLTATSNNANYTYTWSPSTGLSGTTGASVTCTPPSPGNFTYVVIGDDGTCSNVDTVTISVGIPTSAGIASTFQDSICLGKNTDLILTGSVGDIQWQSLNGSTWVNETGPGSTTATYNVSPIINTTYRAYVSSGSCPPDSSGIVAIEVLSISDPVTTNDTICGSGNVNLAASGTGVLTWYDSPTLGSVVNTGSTYVYNATVTDTFYVDAFGGTSYNIGPGNAGFGNQSSTTSTNNYGIAFDVLRPVTIEFVHVFPAQTGTVTINLRQGTAGPVLATFSQAVVAFSGKVAIPVNFSVPVGTGYKMEVASGGPTLTQNTTGAAFPYTVPNGPLAIVGNYNPNLTSTGAYFWLYDWVVIEGCRSGRVPVIAQVNPFPPIPTISQNWNFLTSSSPTGNQWLLNGVIIPGATTQTITVTQTGNYTVAVTINGCTRLSPVFPVLTIGLNEIPSGSVVVYPNPANENLYINLLDQGNTFSEMFITDVTGRVVYQRSISKDLPNGMLSVNTSSIRQGIYMLELKSNDSIVRKQFVIER